MWLEPFFFISSKFSIAGTDSRRQFRSMFPEAPVTNTTLETQQDAMLRHQEEQLRNLRDRSRSKYDANVDFVTVFMTTTSLPYFGIFFYDGYFFAYYVTLTMLPKKKKKTPKN